MSALDSTGHLGFGVGLRSCHFDWLMTHRAEVDWFEIITENFLDNYGYCRKVLETLRRDYPIVMHGVSLSIGSTDPLDRDYLRKLKTLAKEIQPAWISDHLCWTSMGGHNSHDLLPMPLTQASLNHVAERVEQVQDYLGQPLVLENPSTYLEFRQSTFTEWDYLAELAEQTGCELLLDVNNVYVSAYNHGFNPYHYINALPPYAVRQMHLAGPTDCGNHLIDTHDQPVPGPVWSLYRYAQQRTGGTATLLEWDANIPAFPDLVAELNKARDVLTGNMPDDAPIPHRSVEAVSNPIDFHLQPQHEQADQ